MTSYRLAQVWVRIHSSHPRSCLMRIVRLSDCFHISIHFFFFIFISLITLLFLLPVNFIFQDVVDQPVCNSAEDLGTLAVNEPPIEGTLSSGSGE